MTSFKTTMQIVTDYETDLNKPYNEKWFSELVVKEAIEKIKNELRTHVMILEFEGKECGFVDVKRKYEFVQQIEKSLFGDD